MEYPKALDPPPEYVPPADRPNFRFVQGKPNCPFTTYKCPCSGKILEKFCIADIPLEERHKYIDPSQDMNDPRMRTKGDYKIEIVNPLETKVKEQADMINTMLEHLKQLTTAVNNLSK